ncbi:MAG: hypothetical protein NC489_08610 [Ruminococcus flavefaciens]|nr:hypothetical protein [Ruminococcus flavefaciens]
MMSKVTKANVFGTSIFSIASIDAPYGDVTPELFDIVSTADYWNNGTHYWDGNWNKVFVVYVQPELPKIMGWTEPGRTFDTSLTLHIDEVREHLHSLQRHHVTFSLYNVMDSATIILGGREFSTDNCDMTDPANIARYEEICKIMRGGAR